MEGMRAHRRAVGIAWLDSISSLAGLRAVGCGCVIGCMRSVSGRRGSGACGAISGGAFWRALQVLSPLLFPLFLLLPLNVTLIHTAHLPAAGGAPLICRTRHLMRPMSGCPQTLGTGCLLSQETAMQDPCK